MVRHTEREYRSIGGRLGRVAAAASQFGPGRKLLSDSGSVCTDGLVVQGSGTAAKPIVVGESGPGALPEIIGNTTDAVLLENTSNLVVKDLEITNPAPVTKKPPKKNAVVPVRRGVHLDATGTDGTVIQVTAVPCGDECADNLFSGLPPSGTTPVVANPGFINPIPEAKSRIADGKGFRVNGRSPTIGCFQAP